MHSLARSMLATVTLIAASLAAARAQTCPAADDPSLPKPPGVYVQSHEGWFALSNPEFYTPGFGFPHSVFIGSPGAKHGYLMFDGGKAKYRADVTKLVFLVRGLPGWKKAIFLTLSGNVYQRDANITGDFLTQSKRDAIVLAIQMDLRCVRPNGTLEKGEYVLVLYSAEQMPTKRGNFFDFGID